jgi:sugar phosphate isomerase/epimerase
MDRYFTSCRSADKLFKIDDILLAAFLWYRETMRSYKYIPSLLILTVVCILILSISCKKNDQVPNPSAVEQWILGSSLSVRGKFSPDAFKQLKEAGIDYAELGLRAPKFFDGAAKEEFCRLIKEAAAEAGVRIWSVHIPYGKEWDISEPSETARQEVIERHKNLFETFEILQPEKAVIHPSFEPNPPEEREARLEACRKSLLVLSAEAQSYGVELVIENLPRTCLGNTSDEILLLLEGIDVLGVCCDVNHLLKETPQEFIQKVGSRITTLHISDYDGIDERHWPPGKGIIEWDLVLDTLLSIGYSGPFLLEYNDPPAKKAEMWKDLKSAFIQRSQLRL